MSDTSEPANSNDSLGMEAVAKRVDRLFWLREKSTDQLLDHTISLGRLGASVGIGLLVDGVVVIGAVAPIRTFSEQLSKATLEALTAFGLDEQNLSKVQDTLEDLVVGIEKLAEDDSELAKDYLSASLDDIPIKDVPGFLRFVRGHPVIDLQSVQVFATPDPIHLVTMRVERRAISAWWPLTAQGVDVNYGAAQE